MACQNCAKIRAAILHGKMAEAAGLTVDALREKIGFKAAEEPVQGRADSKHEIVEGEPFVLPNGKKVVGERGPAIPLGSPKDVKAK